MSDLPRVGAELAGYRIESLLSRGGMAVVFVARHLRLGRRVALKVLASELAEDDSFRERFIGESLAAAGLDHQNVIPIYDAGEARGVLYIAMRHVDGTDLRGLLRDEGPLDLDRTVSIVSQVAAGLESAHRSGLIHRDVKPGNVLVVPRTGPDAVDHVYLSDFGLAKHAGSISGLTRTGQFVGTVNYVAPEQIEGRPVDARTDVYALGCVLFECLTGAPPFRKPDDLATIMAHVREQPPRLTDVRVDVPVAVADVTARAMAKSPDDRHQSCGELSSALRAAAGSPSRPETPTVVSSVGAPVASPAAAPPAGPSPAAPSPVPSAGGQRSWRAALIAGIVVLVLVGAGSAVLALTGGREDLSGSVYDQIVLPYVPGTIRPTCRERPPPADIARGIAQGTAACTALGGEIRVYYTKVSSGQWLADSFFAVADRELGTGLRGRPEQSANGSCVRGDSAWSFWHRPVGARGAAHAEGPAPRARAGVQGRVVCFRRGGTAVIEWVDPGSDIYSIAERQGPIAPLAAWWRTSSGPAPKPHVSGGGGGTGAGGGGGGDTGAGPGPGSTGGD